MILLATAIVLIGYFWDSIMGYLRDSLLPWVQQNCSFITYGIVQTIVGFIDNAVVATKQRVSACYKWLKNCVLRSSSSYTLEGNNIRETSRTIIDNMDGTYTVHDTETLADKWGMPADVLARLNDNAEQAFTVDRKEAMETKYRQQAQQKLDLQLA